MSHEHQNTNPRTKKQFDHSVPLFFFFFFLEMKKPHSEANLLLLATNPCITIHLFTLKERPPHRNSGTNFEFGPKTSVVGPLFSRQSIAPVSSSNNGELDAFFCVYRNPVPEDFLWKTLFCTGGGPNTCFAGPTPAFPPHAGDPTPLSSNCSLEHQFHTQIMRLTQPARSLHLA